jgi:hypothetical protein
MAGLQATRPHPLVPFRWDRAPWPGSCAQPHEGEHKGERPRRLIDDRRRNGKFSSSDDVKRVTGFEDALVDWLREAGFILK